MNISNTLTFIKSAHKNQYYDYNIEYWTHCVAVAENLSSPTEEEYIAALLHDVVEDTEYDLDDLRNLGFSESILTIVDLLTKVDGSYKDNILRIVNSNNISAIKIKISDNKANLGNTKFMKDAVRSARLIKKYTMSIELLENSLNELEEKL